MKKSIIAFTSILIIFYSCSVDTLETKDNTQNLSQQISEDNTSIGDYKGVFTTINSKYRAKVEITINFNSLGNNISTATLYLQNGETIIAEAESNSITDPFEEINNLLFISENISFYFSVEENGINPQISNVIFKNAEADIILAKHTINNPVITTSGTYVCNDCNQYPLFNNVEQTFNMLIENLSGESRIRTQAVWNNKVYNNGRGIQGNCFSAGIGSFAICRIKSGNNSSDVGFLINGEPVTWNGRHIVVNGQTSLLNGNWFFEGLPFGPVSGTFVND